MKKTALISTNHPEKVIDSCRRLVKLGWRLIGTQETVQAMQKKGIPMEDVASFNGIGYEYGIPPTLHPKIEQALTADSAEPIDLVFDVPYPLTIGNDVGGRALLALGAKGRRLVINNCTDLEKVVRLLEQNSSLLEDTRNQLIAKVNFELAQHFLLLSKRHSLEYDGILGQHKTTCKEGENPYQTPCDLFILDGKDPLGIEHFKQISGDKMCFTNLADMHNISITLEKLKQAFFLNCKRLPYIVVAAKHGNPCGIGVDWKNQDQAIQKALWGNPQAIWGGEVICNFDIDTKLAGILLKSQKRQRLYGSSSWMLDFIVACGFSKDAVVVLSKGTHKKLIVNPAFKKNLKPTDDWHYRFLAGGFLRQPRDNYILKLGELSWTRSSAIDRDSLFIAWVASFTSFHGGNEVSLAKDSMLVGVGGGPSTVMAARHAVLWAEGCKHKTKGAVFCADAFFPFTDAAQILVDAGCRGGVVPAGGKNYDRIYRYFKNKSLTVGFIPAQYRGFCRH